MEENTEPTEISANPDKTERSRKNVSTDNNTGFSFDRIDFFFNQFKQQVQNYNGNKNRRKPFSTRK